MDKIKTENAPAALGHYEQAIAHNGLVYVSGQLPLHPDTGHLPGSIDEQTQLVLQNVKAVLEAADSSLDNVLNVTLYILNIDDWSIINETYAKIFKDHKPARAAVPVPALPKGAKIEVACIAAQN